MGVSTYVPPTGKSFRFVRACARAELEGVPGEAVWGWRVRLLLLLRAVFPAAAAAAAAAAAPRRVPDCCCSSAPCSRLLLLLLLRAVFAAAAAPPRRGRLGRGRVGRVDARVYVRFKNFLRADARVYVSKTLFALTRECMVQKFYSR